jgi:PBP1b-binding outer membrane lipoprotein LpoB
MGFKQLVVTGTIILGALLFSGCLNSPSDGNASKGDPSITLTAAHITHDGTSVLVTGLVDGVESSVLATDVTIDGVAVSRDVSSAISPADDTTCFVCVCQGGSCRCRQVPCP